MESELHKLRIEKSHKARRDERALWPWAIVLLALLGVAAGVWAWNGRGRAVGVSTMRVTVPAGAVIESDLVLLNATGYIMAAHKIELASKVVGRVAWVGVEMGDKVEKGEILVRLEDDEYKARVAEQQGLLDNAKARLAELEAGSRVQEISKAEADLESALADAANAVINQQRLQLLSTGQSVSRQELADAETRVLMTAAQVKAQQQQLAIVREGPRKEQLDAQRATVAQLQGSLALTMVELNNTVIRSPVAGTVLERNVEVGEFVTTGFVGDRGAKGYVVSLADLNDLRVELDVSQDNFAKIARNQPCWITTDAYPDRRYEGNVNLISPEANRQKATVQVRVKVNNPDDLLKPDMNATVAFLSPQKFAAAGAAATRPTAERPAIRVPRSAVRAGAVFVIEEGKAFQRPVVVGNDVGDEVEIRRGLSGGEDLILEPPTGLKEGDAVTRTETP